MSGVTAPLQPQATEVSRHTMAHEEWARLCFEHVVAERRGHPPVMCSLDDLLPWQLIPEGVVEAAVRETLSVGRAVDFIAYGIRRQALTIPLRSPIGPYDYFNIAETGAWGDTKEFRERWSFLRPFVEALPFASTGRAMIMFSNRVGRGVMHFDHDRPTVLHEFVWLKPTNLKRFFLRYGSADHYVTSRSCWFDSRHVHQADEGPDLEVSMRVDGVFTPEFRQRVVERCAPILGIDASPYVLPPDPAYAHPDRSDWQRLFKPRHYSHYFGALAGQLLRTGRRIRPHC